MRRAGRAAVEVVEARTLFAAFVVNTAADTVDANPAVTSLREAIGQANAATTASTITFDPTAFPAGTLTTITLGGSELALSSAVAPTTIQGLGAGRVAVSGNDVSRVFNVARGTVAFSGLTITHGLMLTLAGGGINVGNGATVTVDASILTANTAGFGGAIFLSDDSGSLTLTNSTVSNNVPVFFNFGSGGGLAVDGGDATVVNTTFAGNTAAQGGAIRLEDDDGTITVVNCTIAGNSGTRNDLGDELFQGGIHNEGSAGSVVVRNSIVALNASGDVDGVTTSSSLIGTADPGLELGGGGQPLLKDNGGPTPTIALLPSSAAIDAGANALVPAGVTTDQRGAGFPRIINGIVDIGAFEATTPAGVTVAPAAGLVTTEAGGTATFTVVLNAQPSANVTVPVASSDPTEGTPSASSLMFTPANWNVPQTVTVTGVDDAVDDGNVGYTIVTGDPTSGDAGYDALTAADVADVSVTNKDDDAGVSISDASVAEGNAGFAALTFTVTRTEDNGLATVDWSTAPGTTPGAIADAGFDYLAASGSVVFAPGQLSKTLTVNVIGDTNIESDQSFLVNLSSPNHLEIGDGQGVGTIVNDDLPPPTLSVNDVAVTEGNSGTKNVNFTIALDRKINKPVTVKYTTVGGSATSGTDFVAKSGTLTFAAFAQSAVVTVQVKGDATVEPDEAFKLVLSAPVNAAIAKGTGVGTILNDDKAPPTISIFDAPSIVEGNSGTRTLVYTVKLSSAAAGTVTVNYATADGTAMLSKNDYKAKSGTLTFAPGQTTMTITVTTVGDTRFGPDETVFVNLSGAVGATILDGKGVGTIKNDD